LLVRGFATCLVFLGFLATEKAWAQASIPGSAPASAQPAQPAIPQDALGRTTPRGTVRGFLTAAAGKADYDTATHYLNTRLRGEAAGVLALQLFTVLNRRLPTQLNEISDRPEGSLTYAGEPDKELVGTIDTDTGKVDILLERVDRKSAGSVWLFSRESLDAIPELYAEVSTGPVENGLIRFLVETRIAHISLIQWLALFVGLPLLNYIGIRLNRSVSALLGTFIRRRRKNPDLPNPEFLAVPVRLLLLALIIRWILSTATVPLLARQFWSTIAAICAIAGSVWLVILVNRIFEDHVRLRLGRRKLTGALSILSFVRWAVDALAIFIGLLVALHHLGFNPTTALAGLGVGGIAIALAAQKTLENVIAGVSLISDQAIRVGDFLKVGDTLGTVSDIGLRSTRIRTLNRTVVSVPNGLIANTSLENLSLRDQFWFHHQMGLPYETSAGQIRAILQGVTNLLAERPEVDKRSPWVRLVRFGVSSLDLEIFAYVSARDWPDFLRIQEDLLLQLMDIIETVGTRIALPSQTMYLPNSAVQAFRAEMPGQEIAENTAAKLKPRKHASKPMTSHATTS
jgi:MscS family membrane protein